MDLEIPFKGAPQDTRQSSQVPPKPMPTEDEAPLRRRADKPIAAVEFLRAGLGHMEDRASTYDKPEGERSMGNTVAMFNIATGHTLTEEQGWLFMILLKAVRSQQGNFRADNYEDGAAYFGLMGETGSRDRRARP